MISEETRKPGVQERASLPNFLHSLEIGPDLPPALRDRARALAAEVAASTPPAGGPGGLPVGTVVGPYEVIGPLGRGGQATVYRAKHRETGREVALKIPHQDVAPRLVREAKLLAKLDHPRIVRIEAADFDGPVPYLALELCAGSLRERLARADGRRRLLPGEASAIGADVLRALEHAHAQGVVHRDLKPENILFDADGHAKVADFGIGKLSLDGDAALAHSQARSAADGSTAFAGTPLYAAPEQEDPAKRENGRIDGRADLFALGKVLYEALTGDSPRTIRPVSRVCPQLDRRWDAFIFKLVEDRPAQRYCDAEDAREALDQLGRPVPVGRLATGAAAALRGGVLLAKVMGFLAWACLVSFLVALASLLGAAVSGGNSPFTGIFGFSTAVLTIAIVLVIVVIFLNIARLLIKRAAGAWRARRRA